MTDYYFLFDANAPDLVDILGDCYQRNKTAGIGRTMREAIARDGQTYFCKVANVDQYWLDSRTWQQGSVIWAFPYTDTNGIGYKVQRAWNLAQCPIFYPGHTPTGDNLATDQERHDYWHNIWQSLL